jgi:hypothetical protein
MIRTRTPAQRAFACLEDDPGGRLAKEARKVPEEQRDEKPAGADSAKACTVCGTKLSSYNPGPNCWQHTIGYPWRGPSAKPRYD